MKDLKTAIQGLIETDSIETLKMIRAGYTKFLPIELIHPEDREICEVIDKFIELNENIIKIIEEKAPQSEGLWDLNFDYDIFNIRASGYNYKKYSPGDNLTPSSAELIIDIKEKEIILPTWD